MEVAQGGGRPRSRGWVVEWGSRLNYLPSPPPQKKGGLAEGSPVELDINLSR